MATSIREKRIKRARRHRRVRSRIAGTAERPRLSVFRSNKHLYLQLIDDMTGRTLLTLGDHKERTRSKRKETAGKMTRVEHAEKLGEEMSKEAMEKNITSVLFDRGGYAYHGIIKAVAEGARKGGLRF